ncbi:MAG: hypothetical protein ABH882_02445 [Candidatus Omnitrophota bacterium]
MEEQVINFNFLRVFFLITSPVIFMVGIFLLYDLDTYLKIEKFLGRGYASHKKSLVKWLDNNRESLQLFLLRKRRTIGIICLLNSLLAIYVNIILPKN